MNGQIVMQIAESRAIVSIPTVIPQPFGWTASPQTLKRGSQSQIRTILKRLMIAAVLMPLGACNANQESDFASCRLDALKTYPNERPDFAMGTDAFIELCMELKGYVYDVHPAECGRGDFLFPLREDVVCYRKRSLFSN